MNKQEALEFLDDPRRYGSDTDPALLRAALQRLGSPESGFTIIHLAGTNGKGSTGAYLSSVLRSFGESTGHFTSPHVTDFLERIRINGENCDPTVFARAAEFVRDTLQEMDRFEAIRAFSLQLFTALIAFRNAGVRFAIIEAGIGGRDDATNVLLPRVSVITPIGLDHMSRLGSTVEEIAMHKAGIIKPGVPVFSAPQTAGVDQVIAEAARVNNAPLIRLDPSQLRIERSDPFGVTFLWEDHLKLHTSMGGRYQADNAGLALLVARHLIPDLSDEVLLEGIERAEMPGRRQLVARDPLIVVDGAHNRHAIEAFCTEDAEKPHDVGIIGMMEDKETEEVLRIWRRCFHTLFFVPVEDDRSWNPEKMKRLHYQEDAKVQACASLEEAIQRAKLLKPGSIYIMGSLYLAGEALHYFQSDQ